MNKHSNYYNQVIAYCNDIQKGKILSCDYVKKAINRFLNDLDKEKQESWLFYFDEEQFCDVVSFVESITLPDTKQKIKLLPWQLFIYANLFGFYYKDNHKRRRFRQAYCEVARKNGKTSAFLYPLILYDFLSEQSAESYMFSADGNQAEKSFKEVTSIIKENPELDDICDCFSSTITMKDLKDTSRITFFSAEAGALDGYRNSMTILDEFWCYSSDKPLTAARFGGRARLNNLVVVITSAGLDIGSPCYAENTKCKSVLNKSIQDESYFGIIYSYDEGDDWANPDLLIKSNPSLGAFLKLDVLKSDLTDALITASHQPDYKSKTCGIWTNATVSWIPLEKWKQDTDIDFNELKDIPCYGGIDLSSVNDLTVFTLCWHYKDKYYFKHRLYIPEEQLLNKYKTDNINFIEWVNKGIITSLPGATIDYQYIYDDILADKKEFNIQEIAYDRWQANFLINKLNDELPEIVYIEYDQSLKKFSPPTKDYEREILSNNIVDSNPIMPWCISNVTIRPDNNNNYKPMKDSKHSTRRIDPVVTSIMALDRCKANTMSVSSQDFHSVLVSF